MCNEYVAACARGQSGNEGECADLWCNDERQSACAEMIKGEMHVAAMVKDGSACAMF